MDMTWSEVNVSELLEADFFEFKLKLWSDNDSVVPTEITPEVYYQHLYVSPKKANDYNELLKQVTISRRSRLFFIEGFAGCGKSTLVNRIFYDITNNEKRAYDYSDFNYKLGNSRYDYNYGANTCPESNDEVNSLIREKLAVRIASYLNEDLKVYECFQYLANGSDIIKIDKGRTIYNRLVNADVIKETFHRANGVSEEEKVNMVTELMRAQLLDFKTPLLLATDFLWRLAQYIVLKEKSYLYVAYDNLDAIDYPDVLESFDDELVAFIENLNNYIDDVYPKISQRYEVYKKPTFSIFATYRKITAARVNLHKHEVQTESREKSSCIVKMDVSDYFDYCDIVNNKVSYFLKEAEKNKIIFPAERKLEMVMELNDTKIIRERYKAFWNHNFRGCANIMQEIVDSGRACVPKGIQLMKEQCDGENSTEETNVSVYIGASSVFLRIICDLFRDGNILGSRCLNLIPLNQPVEYGYTTLSRLILNFYNVKGEEQINELFLALKGIYTPTEIAEELATLLDKNDIWRRPLYYTMYALPNDGLRDALKKQAIYFESNDVSFTHYAKLQLCPCGEIYINLVATSFEFFACRCLKDSKPLYCEESLDEITQVIEKVFESVENCCKNLSTMREKIKKQRGISNEDFLNLPFHSITRSKKTQLHEERVIFSHISYLELFRQFKVMGIMDEDKKKINMTLVDAIIKYLQLYDTYIAKIDGQRVQRADILKSKADAIKEKEYWDNEIKIQS